MEQQQRTPRPLRLNARAFEHAKQLIAQGKSVVDERDAWSEHQPSSEDENGYIRDHGWAAYARWYLGINEQAADETKERYEFPFGDFDKVHRCGVLSAESRAAQYRHLEIESAAAHLHGMLDAVLVPKA